VDIDGDEQMNRIRSESVHVVQEAVLGERVKVSKEASELLSSDAEIRIRSLLEKALSTMRHSKRSTLLPSDMNSALKASGAQPILGYANPAYKYPNNSNSSEFQSVAPNSGLYFRIDPEIALREYFRSPLPALEYAPSLNLKWLHIPDFNSEIVSDTNALVQRVWILVRDGCRTRNYEMLFAAMRLVAKCLKVKGGRPIESYVHQLLPPVLTCAVGVRSCSQDKNCQWELRQLAASLIGKLCRLGTRFSVAKIRATKTLLSTLLDAEAWLDNIDLSRSRCDTGNTRECTLSRSGLLPLCALYGSLLSLQAIGGEVLRMGVVPQSSWIEKVLHVMLNDSPQFRNCCTSQARILNVYQILFEILQEAHQNTNPSALSIPDPRQMYENMYDTFGDTIIPYISVSQKRSRSSSTSHNESTRDFGSHSGTV